MLRKSIMLGAVMLGCCFFHGIVLSQGRPSVSFILQPVDLGVGIRADFYPLRAQCTGRRAPGVYFSASYGNRGLYREQGLKDHVKATAGVLIPLKPYRGWGFDISFAVNYHHLGPGTIRDYSINQKIYESLSWELGHTVKFKRLVYTYTLDTNRWEPCLGLGLLF